MNCGHKPGGLFVASQDKFDLGARKGIQQIEILLTGHAEDRGDPFLLKTKDK